MDYRLIHYKLQHSVTTDIWYYIYSNLTEKNSITLSKIRTIKLKRKRVIDFYTYPQITWMYKLYNRFKVIDVKILYPR